MTSQGSAVTSVAVVSDDSPLGRRWRRWCRRDYSRVASGALLVWRTTTLSSLSSPGGRGVAPLGSSACKTLASQPPPTMMMSNEQTMSKTGESSATCDFFFFLETLETNKKTISLQRPFNAPPFESLSGASLTTFHRAQRRRPRSRLIV